MLLLHLRLDGEANGLTSHSLLNIDALVVDTFDLYRVKLTLLIRAKQKRSAWNDSSCEEGTSHDNTDTSYLVETINQELNGVGLESELSRESYPGLKEAHKLLKARNALSVDIRD